MAVVFISHAHEDELLAQKIASLLGMGLGLSRDAFFLSSEEGRGVAPAANILESILAELQSAPAFIVLLTPRAAASPWVWLEAGNRLGCADKANPIFVVPSDRFAPLLKPVAELRYLGLDNDGQLHELLQAVGRSLDKSPIDVLQYKPALDDLLRTSARAYSASAMRTTRTVSWLRSHAVGLVLAAAGLAMLAYGWAAARDRPAPAGQVTIEQMNEAIANTAAGFLVLKGRVTSGPDALHGAEVMVSREGEVRDPNACQEPACTKRSTTTEGEFRIDLTRIQARKDEPVVISVFKEGFKFFSTEIDVDVRAMDVSTAPLNVVLSPQAP